MPVLRRLPVKISEKELLRLQGSSLSSRLQDRSREAVEEAGKLVRPLATYSIKRTRQVANSLISLEDGTEFHGENLVRLWQGATLLGMGLCTIGPLLESRVSELYSQGNILAAPLLDRAGSLAVESVANGLNYHLCQWASRRGLNMGPRLSPGYGQWNVVEQRLLFRILPGGKIGVHLNEQCMMMPVKSISFCVGIGSGVSRYIGTTEPCHYCTMDNCQYRV